MKRKLVLAAMAAGLVIGASLIGTEFAGASAQSTATTAQPVLMKGSQDLTGGAGLVYVKLRNARTGKAALSGRYAVSSATFAQFGGSQALPVALRMATCDNANGFGAFEDVAVPQNQTVHLDFPKAVPVPFVATAPTSWCLYAATVPDNGQLSVNVVATKVS